MCVCVTFLGNQASADIFKLRWVLLDRGGPWSSAWGPIRREKSGPRRTGARPRDNAGRAVVTLPQAKDRQGPLHHHGREKATRGAPKKAQPCWYLDLSLLSSRAVRGYTSAVLSPSAAVLGYGNLQTRTSSAPCLPCQKDQMRSQRICFSVSRMSRCHRAQMPRPRAVQPHPRKDSINHTLCPYRGEVA